MRRKTIKIATVMAIAAMCGCVPQGVGLRATATDAAVAPKPPDTTVAMGVAAEAFAGQILATGKATLVIVDHNEGLGSSSRDWIVGFDGHIGIGVDPVDVLFGANLLLGTRERAAIKEPIIRTTTIAVSGDGGAALTPP